MILIYAETAPLRCRAGPSKPPSRLRDWFWMTATLNFKIVVGSVCCQQYHPLWWSELCQAGEHLSRQGPGHTSAEPPCCRNLTACRRTRYLSPFLLTPSARQGGGGDSHYGQLRRHRGALGLTQGWRGAISEMPSLGPPQQLMPKSHRHPQGPFLTTDSVLKVPITTISTHLKSFGSDCSSSFPHPGESGSPWCLSGKSQ